MQKETQKTLNLQTGLIDIPKFDAKKYIGMKVKIASVIEGEGNFGYYIRITTEKVEKFGDKEICASKLFGLQTDEEGNIGWGKDTKLGSYLKKMKVSHYKDLVGKEVIIQTKTKDGLEFLDFN
jgi:hypothetical protein